MLDKKHNIFKAPNLNDLQEIVIDERTKIYVPLGTDPAEAKSRYLLRQEAKNKVHEVSKKTVTPIENA